MIHINFLDLGKLAFVSIFGLILYACEKNDSAQNQIFKVPEGFAVEEAVSPDLISYPMFATFDLKGRLFLFESSEANTMGTEAMLAKPSYHIRMLEDQNGDGKYEKSVIYADDIPFPMGGVFHNGSLYVTAAPNLLRFKDSDADGQADIREVLLEGWTLNSNGAILSGPFLGHDGWLYMAGSRRGFSILTQEGKLLEGKGARIWRCLPDGSRLEWMCGGGFDNSIEIIFMPSGESIGTMTYFTDPQNGQRDALMHWVEGGIYPKYHSVIVDDHLKLTGDLMPVMTKLPRVAPSGLMRYKGPVWGDEYDGNLFTAEFNTGRIMRYRVREDGATYATEDEPFALPTTQDVHPTDVLEDADGSILVVVTGGWFIEGCPLSQVAKPEVKGGLYRIRKKRNSKKLKDGWGKSIDFEKLTVEKLTAYLSDPRPMVRKHTADNLIARGGSSVPAIRSRMLYGDEQVKTEAVFILHQIGTRTAQSIIREALEDESIMVRVAAARCVGLSKDRESVLQLMDIIEKGDALPVLRQAAAALGQIGDKDAVPALLKSAANSGDRMVEHAIIHALTMLSDHESLLMALAEPEPNVRKAALVALDQMDDSPLEEKHVIPFLISTDETDREIGIWTTMHHPEWSSMILDFIKQSLPPFAKMDSAERKILSELIRTSCDYEEMQRYVASQFEAAGNSDVQRLFFLDVMGRCRVSKVPSSWQGLLERMLQNSTDSVLLKVLNVIESRGLPSMDEALTQIIGDRERLPEFRFKALNARNFSRQNLSDSEFDQLLEYLAPQHESFIRQTAARLLAQSQLDDRQLTAIATDQIPKADPFLLPSLIDPFNGCKSEAVGLALVDAIAHVVDGTDNLSRDDLVTLIGTFPESVGRAAAPLLAVLNKKYSERLTKLQALEESLGKGDVGEGRKQFYAKGLCSSCHAVGTDGGTFGPDLTNIGEIRSRQDLLEAIIYPSVSFAREYETFRVSTETKSYLGVVTEQTSMTVSITIGPGPAIRIPRSEIISMEPHHVSMMPSGLDKQMSAEKLADLIAFLQALPYRLDRLIELGD